MARRLLDELASRGRAGGHRLLQRHPFDPGRRRGSDRRGNRRPRPGPPRPRRRRSRLLTGGARGITARAAVAIAGASGCHIELVGRTPPAAGDRAWATAHADDEIGLRHTLVESGVRRPAEVETTVRRVLAEREVRTTMAALAGCAASVRYHVADVRDPAAIQAVVADVHARHGRLDGVVHGAGVCEDGLLAAKSPRVPRPGLGAPRCSSQRGVDLVDALGVTPLRFLALFGSVSRRLTATGARPITRPPTTPSTPWPGCGATASPGPGS